MAVTHKHRNWLAYQREVTPATVAGAWATEGLTLLHREIETTGIVSGYTDDPILETYGQAVMTRDVLEQARNVEFKFATDLYGLGVTTALDDQAVANPLTDLIEDAMGGASYSNTTEITGGTAALPIVDDVTNYAAGQLAQFIDTTSPVKANQVHWRCVTAVDNGAKTLALSEKLSFTPAAGDDVPAAATFYLDELVLEDAVANSKTNSWFVQMHPTNASHVWETRGCVHSMNISGLERNAPPKLDFAVFGANYKYSDADGLACVTFAETPFGYPPLTLHELKCSISEVTDDEHNYVSVSSFALEMGVTREPVQTITEPQTLPGFDGLHSYTVKFAPTELTIVIPVLDKVWYQGLSASKHYRVTLYQGSKGAGKSWCIHLRDCQIISTPTRAEAGEANAVQIKFRAVPNSAGADAMQVSRVLVGIG